MKPYFIIAGEASGDLLGARLMRAMKEKAGARFIGIGGPRMRAEGMELLFPQEELAHFGVFELLRHLPRLFRRIKETRAAVLHAQPQALISIDSPDFCFRVAKPLKGSGIPLIHYVAPTVWAWRPKRAKKIARFLSHLLVLLPFEPPYFTREGLPCTFVGHAIVESDAGKGDAARFHAKFKTNADTLWLTVLPGSRMSEASCLMPIFGETLKILKDKHPALHVVIPVVPHLATFLREQSQNWTVPVTFVDTDTDKYDAFAASRAALACSGTVALELALARLPAVIAYKISNLTAFVYRRFIKIKYVNLVNLMLDRMAVPERLQENCTPEKLAEAVHTLLCDDAERNAQIAALTETGAWLGEGQGVPSIRAAETILKI